jgi:hypothetical protein
MRLTKPAGCFVQLVGAPLVILGVLYTLLAPSHGSAGALGVGVILLTTGIAILWLGRQTAGDAE